MSQKRTWTDEQSKAINTRDRTLLISAAAGAGKTATLTERIIRSLLDEENPENINEMLIVTFTKAAVAELRDRIGQALRRAVAENPDSERLRGQLALLPSAKIQTIDSFCVDILRKNCDRVGVSPAFRIPDEAEAKLLAEGEDGLSGEFCHQIRGSNAAQLRLILDEQADLDNAEETAYIKKVLAEKEQM